jgi:hypothetical protein
MSGDLKKIFKNLDDLERKVTKSNKIVQKGEKMSLGDAIKLGRKSNSITSTINKGIKEYDVGIFKVNRPSIHRADHIIGCHPKRRRRKKNPRSDAEDCRPDRGAAYQHGGEQGPV